jgi:hypothetical protein
MGSRFLRALTQRQQMGSVLDAPLEREYIQATVAGEVTFAD